MASVGMSATVNTATIEVTSRMRKIGKPRTRRMTGSPKYMKYAMAPRLVRAVGALRAGSHEKAQRDQHRHQRVADRNHRLRDDQREIRRLAALVELRQLRDDGPRED